MNSSEVLNAGQNGTASSAISQLISEIKQFIKTRTDLFKMEIKQKLPLLRTATLLGLAGGLLLLIGYLFLAIAVVVLIGSAFPQNPYRWFFGLLIVGILSLGFGAIGAFLTKSGFGLSSILPKRILDVLKGDKDWMMSEIRQHK